MSEPISSFLNTIAGELGRRLSAGRSTAVSVSWNRDKPAEDLPGLLWWSCALSIDSACQIHVGGSRETWDAMLGPGTQIGGDVPDQAVFAPLEQSIEETARTRFGKLVSCTGAGLSEAPADVRNGVFFQIAGGGGISTPMHLVLSPDLAAALGGAEELLQTEASPARAFPAGAGNPGTADMKTLDILMNVEIPVSVSFGRTQMAMKDLLALTNGSVVELDRELGDQVEIRVNNCVIARGEVVAVEGNYAVRIVEIVSNASVPTVRTMLRAAG